MSGSLRPYNHPARQLTGEDRAAGMCTACGRGVIGFGPTLRHIDEAFRAPLPEPADQPSIEAAVAVVLDALDQLPPWEITNADRARAAVMAVYLAGGLRPRKPAWKPPRVRAA